jgi:hypothetical protein
MIADNRRDLCDMKLLNKLKEKIPLRKNLSRSTDYTVE